MDSVSLAPKVNRQWSLESHSANHKELQASRMALCPNGALAVLASGKKGQLFPSSFIQKIRYAIHDAAIFYLLSLELTRSSL